MPKIIENYVRVPIVSVRPNAYNYNEQDDKTYAAERASIQEFGFLDAVTVRRIPTPGPDGVLYEIVDGEHRWKAMQEEGATEIVVNDLGALDDDKAKRLTVVLNETKGKPNTVRLAALVKELAQTTPVEQLALTLPYTAEQLDGLCKLTEFDWDQYRARAEAAAAERKAAGQDPDRPTPPAQPAASGKSDPPPGMPAGGPSEQRLVLVVPAPACTEAARYLQVLGERYPGLTEADLVVDALRRFAQGVP